MGAPGSAARRRWVVGLTGGIASGKSRVAAEFAALGADVIELDEIAREVVAPDTPLLGRVLQRFGQQLKRSDGSLDRRALRKRVFGNDEARAELEALLHPAIVERTGQRIAESTAPYQIVVHPLLAETAARARYNRVLLVDCDPGQQRARLAARDGSDPAEVEAMMAAQTTRAARLTVADDVLDNSGSPAQLAAAVAELHQRYLGLAGSQAQ
jgi:dephospho-CoA kinase